MMKQVESFLKKFTKKNEMAPLFKVYPDPKRQDQFFVNTDGDVYTTFYDTSMTEVPYLMSEAADEFGVPAEKKKQMVQGAWNRVYKKEADFHKMFKDKGWFLDKEGGGVLVANKE